MKGTEKQIAWANEIKDKFIATNLKLNDESFMGKFDESEIEFLKKENELFQKILKIEASKFWIDFRNMMSGIDVDYEWIYKQATKENVV